MNIINADKDFCDDYENVVSKEYEKLINGIEGEIKDIEGQIKQSDQIKTDNSNLSKFTHIQLQNLNELTDKWLDFYPTFSATYKIRSNLTEVEFRQLAKMRNSFDSLFPYSATLSQLTQDQKFISANFSSLTQSISAYYNKASTLIDDLENSLNNYKLIIDQNSNITLNSNDNSTQLHYMESQFISTEELKAFQNEFLQINQYIKKFLNYIMKKIKETDAFYDDLKIKLNSSKEKKQELLKRIEIQKQKLYTKLLE
jgi:hypothetical protein